MHTASTFSSQVNIREFAFMSYQDPTFNQLLLSGLTIVFCPSLEMMSKVNQRCVDLDVARINYLHHTTFERALAAWQRMSVDNVTCVLIVNQYICTGWRTYADRVIWIGPDSDKQLPTFKQAGTRLRGKEVEPILINPKDI